MDFSIKRGERTVRKLIEVQNNIGLTKRVIMSKECYDEMWKSADNFKIRHGCLRFYYKPTEKTPKIIVILEGPIWTLEHRDCYRLKKLKHDKIDYSSGGNTSEQFFFYEGED